MKDVSNATTYAPVQVHPDFRDLTTSGSVSQELLDEIAELRRLRNAVILAHNYQVGPIQDVADFVGDSLALAQTAARTNASVIVMCGVYFMAETAKILNPSRTVLIPDAGAGCSLADSIDADQLRAWKAEYPSAVVVSYVNTTAEVKAESDYCVTSGNAADVIASIPPEREILFLPDMFLGAHLERVTGRRLHVWPGECHVHAGIRPEEIETRRRANPAADLLVHPECGCTAQVLWAHAAGEIEEAYVLSTEKMIAHARQSPKDHFLVATETGILHRLQKEAPGKRFEAADPGAMCRFMKMITPTNLRDALVNLAPQVNVEPEIAARARVAIERMLAVPASRPSFE